MQRPSEAVAPSAAWTAEADALVSLRDVFKTFPSGKQTVRAVDGVSLDILQGETLGLVGESGCGKSTLGRVVTQLQPVTAGSILFEGEDLATLHRRSPLLYLDSGPLGDGELSLSDGLFLSLDVSGPEDSIVGYRAKKNSLPIDLTKVGALRWRDYWEPVHPEQGGRIVLEPEVFYLLLSAEGVSIPPSYAAEMLAYDPTAGELRTHYAGFFDPGFGYAREGPPQGSRAACRRHLQDVACGDPA